MQYCLFICWKYQSSHRDKQRLLKWELWYVVLIMAASSKFDNMLINE